MFEWFADTLRTYPEIAIFPALALGYYFGKFTFRGIGLGSVTATLLAGVVIGQTGVTIQEPLKATVFLLFLFAVGYGVGPQFVRGVAKDGLPQAIFCVVQCLFCLLVPVAIAKVAGYDLGYTAGLYSGSQTISAAMGLSIDAINRLGLTADQTKAMLDAMPVAYAVSYMFGTVGSAIVIALICPALVRIDLVAACKDYEAKQGGTEAMMGGAHSAWHRWELRAFQVKDGGKAVGLRVVEAEALVPHARVFIERLRRGGTIEEATVDTVIRAGDVLALAGPREVLVSLVGQGGKEVRPAARGVFLRSITRGATATSIPILPNTTIQRGDILTLVGRTRDTAAATRMLGVADRPTEVADVAFIGGAITLGALSGALVWRVAGVPITLSTAGGALIAGIVFGWLRSTRPVFGRIPSSTVWFMNSVGLNMFIAVVGISTGPGFVDGLRSQGLSLLHPQRVAHDHRSPWPRLRPGPEPGARSRLHRDLRRRQHAAHHLGHGARDAPVLKRALTRCSRRDSPQPAHETPRPAASARPRHGRVRVQAIWRSRGPCPWPPAR